VSEDLKESKIGILGFSVTRKSRWEKSRNSETRWSQSHSQVSTHIGVRDLEGSVDKCYGNRDIPTRDFPITTRVWAIGTRARDKAVALWYNGHMDQEFSPKV
jgi:hypothetical protein